MARQRTYFDQNGIFFSDEEKKVPATLTRRGSLQDLVAVPLRNHYEGDPSFCGLSVKVGKTESGTGFIEYTVPKGDLVKMKRVAEKATPKVAGEKITFHHGPYGGSYFGSGGGYGSARAYSLSKWREGVKERKQLSFENGDNGFMAGPDGATMESDTILICQGGDCIGENGREWGETYICE